MRDIFVSYRRSDSPDVTGRIFDQLKERFREDRLFKDVEAIPFGSDFRQVISASIAECKVLLAIIGDDWLKTTKEDGSRRLDDVGDYVHVEIATALQRGIPVIPVLVENASVPKSEDLPDALKELAFRNAISIRPDPDFHHDIDRLCRQLATFIGAVPNPQQTPSMVLSPAKLQGYVGFLDNAITQQRSAIPFYVGHACAVIGIGVVTLVIGLLTQESYKWFMAIGGTFVSALSGLPVKQILDRKQRIAGLGFLKAEFQRGQDNPASIDPEQVVFAEQRLRQYLDVTLGFRP